MGLRRDVLNQILTKNATASTDAYENVKAKQHDVAKQKSSQDHALSQLIKGDEIKQAETSRNLEQVKSLRSLLGKDASIGVGDVRIDPRNYEAMRFAQGMSDKEADNERLETAALQGEYNKLSGKSREKMEALKEIDDLLANPSAVSEGQLRTALARAAGDVGALSEGDVNRTLPRTLGADVKGAWNYVTGGTESRLSPEQITAVQRLVKDKRSAVQGRLGGSGTELRTRAQTLAPSLHRKGKLDSVLQGLGAGTQAQGGDDKQRKLDAIMNRIQELEAKRNAQ